MSEAMEEIQRLTEKVESLEKLKLDIIRQRDEAEEELAGMTEARNRFNSSINRLAEILGLSGKQCYSPDAVERKARGIAVQVEELEKNFSMITDTRNAYQGCIERLSGIFGLEGSDSCVPNAVERKAKAVAEEFVRLKEYGEFMNIQGKERDRQIEELESENQDLAKAVGEKLESELVENCQRRIEELETEVAEVRSTFEILDAIPENLRELVKKREAYAERLENKLGAEEQVVEMLKGKLDRGETFDEFEKRIVELLNEDEPKRALKRLSSFMRYTLRAIRENRELSEKNITLDAENDHLSKSIDAMNSTLQEVNGATKDVGEAVEELTALVDETPEAVFVEEEEGGENGAA